MDTAKRFIRDGSRAFFFSLVKITPIFVVAFLISCGGPQRDIMGKWRANGEGQTMVWEFAGGGSVKMGSSQGRYSFGNQGRIKIETSVGISVYQMELAGDRMSLRDPTGSRLEFTRVK